MSAGEIWFRGAGESPVHGQEELLPRNGGLPDPDPVAIADEIAARLADAASLHDLGECAAAWASESLWTCDERAGAEITLLDALVEGSAAGWARGKRGNIVVRHRARYWSGCPVKRSLSRR